MQMEKNQFFKNRTIKFFIIPACILSLVFFLSACGINSGVTTSAQATPVFSIPPPTSQIINLLGAGAAPFDRLAYQWEDEYFANTGVKICYQPVGTSMVLDKLSDGTMNFLAFDSIMTPDQIKTAEGSGGTILSIPVAISIITVAYNLPDLKQGTLQLTGSVLADIYMGKIVKWNDPAISAINPGLSLPDAGIITIYDDEQSGANYIFSDFLAKASQDWKTKYGAATWDSLPGNQGATGEDGKAALISQTPDSIGYVELGSAKKYALTTANIQNNDKFISPTPESASLSAEGITIPDDTLLSITNSTQSGSYPIDGFIWMVVYQNQIDKGTGETLVNVLSWILSMGQQDCQNLDYAPLSQNILVKAENLVSSIKYQGTPLLTTSFAN